MFLTAEKGLTSSAANHIANVAKEMAEEDLRIFGNTTTLTQTMFEDDHQIRKTEANFNKDEADVLLSRRPRLFQLSAWLREAVKYKDGQLKQTMGKLPAEQYPESPKSPLLEPDVGDEWGINQLDIKDRAKMLAAEAKAAAYGKYLHNNGPLVRLRREAEAPGLEWTETTPARAVQIEKDVGQQKAVNELFYEYQKRHRSCEKVLNAFRSKIHDQVTARNKEIAVANEARMAKYRADRRAWDLEIIRLAEVHNKEQLERRQKIAAMKIAIPDDLQEIFDYVKDFAG